MKLVLPIIVVAAASEQKQQNQPKRATNSPGKPEKRAPIVTSGLIFDTAAVLYDVGDMVYTNVFEPQVVKHGPKAKAMFSLMEEHVQKHKPILEAKLDNFIEAALVTASMQRKDVMQKYDTMKLQARSFQANLETGHSNMKTKMDALTAKYVAKFDEAMPRHAGVMPNSFGDFLFFLMYFGCFLYVLLRILRKCFEIALGIFCFFCCCGCICRGSKPKKVVPSGKVKANDKASDKANEKVSDKATDKSSAPKAKPKRK